MDRPAEPTSRSFLVNRRILRMFRSAIIVVMSQHSIIEKLGGELRLPLRRESQVLYVMAEVRKYLEIESELGAEDFPELEFFCNWVLHTKISYKSSATHIRAFLQPFDVTPGMSIEEYLNSQYYQTILQLELLRTELRRFFNKHGLPVGWIDEHNGWAGFEYLYTSIVSEVPLEYSKGDLLPDEVEKVEIERFADPIGKTPQKLTRWTITLKNGKSFSSSLYYGTLRDKEQKVIKLPDFWDESFQL